MKKTQIIKSSSCYEDIDLSNAETDFYFLLQHNTGLHFSSNEILNRIIFFKRNSIQFIRYTLEMFLFI